MPIGFAKLPANINRYKYCLLDLQNCPPISIGISTVYWICKYARQYEISTLRSQETLKLPRYDGRLNLVNKCAANIPAIFVFRKIPSIDLFFVQYVSVKWPSIQIN